MHRLSKVFVGIVACIVPVLAWYFAGSGRPTVDSPPPKVGNPAPDPDDSRPRSKDERIQAFRKWLAAGGANAANRDRIVEDFFYHIEGNMPPDELLALVLEEFPSELREAYADYVMQNICRKEPLEGAKFLSVLPPGGILNRGVEIIAARAGEKGLDPKAVIAWANALDFEEDREQAVKRFLVGRDWSGVPAGNLKAILALLSSGSEKTLLVRRWLDAGGQPSALSEVGDPSILAAVAEFEKLQAGKSIPSASGKTDNGGKSSGSQRELRDRGAAAYDVHQKDFGYGQLLAGLADRKASPDESHEAAAGWYWTLVGKNPDAALALFEKEPAFQDSEFVSALTYKLMGVDRARMKDWISDHSRDPAFIKQVISIWLEQDSVEASDWIGKLPSGELKSAAMKTTADWLRKKGDEEAAKQWDDTSAVD